MFNLNSGIVKIAGDLLIGPGYTFTEFKRTQYYKGQDGVRIIYLKKPQIIMHRSYIVSLFFRNNIIYMISLICVDIELSETEEKQRKRLHDEILKNQKINPEVGYDWGKITSEYDSRSNISSINIYYNT